MKKTRNMWYYMPWLVGMVIVLFFVLVILLVVLILSGVTVHWLKDSHFHVDDACNDGDPCTKCLELKGGCFCLPRPDGHKCHSMCFHDEIEESPFETHKCRFERFSPFGEWTDKNICVGTECKGNCLLTADCPDITFRDDVEAPSTKDCDSFACYYHLDLTGENDDLDIQCHHDSLVYQQLCYKKLNQTDPIVQDHCLVAEPECAEEEQDIVGCYYFFRCACPTEEIPIVAKRNVPSVGGEPLSENERGETESPMGMRNVNTNSGPPSSGNKDRDDLQHIQQVLAQVDNKPWVLPKKSTTRRTRSART